jgi:lipid II:glycine glycyltransferase (peptidoglycan interpeptide bridge formation enzyme)
MRIKKSISDLPQEIDINQNAQEDIVNEDIDSENQEADAQESQLDQTQDNSDIFIARNGLQTTELETSGILSTEDDEEVQNSFPRTEFTKR